MSKPVELLEIDKCIISRLWYTASVILNTETESHYVANYTRDDVDNLRSLIKSTVDSQNQEQFRWMSYRLLLCLDKKNSAKVQQELESIQFATALQLIDDQIPVQVEQELKELFEVLSNAKHNQIQSLKKISQTSLIFLENNLQKNPALTCWLINELLCIWPTSFAYSDEILQDLYCTALKSIIEKAVACDDERKEGQFSVSDLHTKKIILDEKSLGTLLCILCKLDVTETKEDELLSWLYPALLRVCDTDNVELTLYSRKNVKFLKEWDKFLDKAFVRLESPSNYENALKIADAIFRFENDSVSIDARELSMRIMRRGTHWMSDILDLCYTLLANGDYNRVSKLLSCPPLKYLWPSLMLQFLSNFPHIPITTSIETWQKNAKICRSLNFLLDKCTLNSKNPTLQKSNAIMKRHLKVIDWILECKKKVLGTACYSSPLEQSLSVKKILSRLETSCILSVLKSSVDLHEEEYNEVQDLLKDTYEASNVFHSYRAMLSALKAILSCEYFNYRHKEVEKNFLEMESLLGSLFPLTLRLEVIENIFSFLFLRHEDFCDADRSSEEDENEKEKATSALENKELEQKKFGFAANKFTIREVLQRLKNCVLTAGIESLKQKRESGISSDWEQINKELTNVNKAIADALWRLEFLTSADFLRRAGTVDNEKISYESKVNLDGKLNFSARLKNKSIFYKEGNSSSDEDCLKSDVDLSSEAGSLDNALSLGRRKKRIKNLINVENVVSKDSSSRFIINIMLMSKESWVLQCLWKGDHLKAQQIIEMFDMKGTPLDGEVRFSKAINLFRQELNNYLNPSDVVDSPMNNSTLSTLQNIRQAAQEGFQSSRITGQLETFLASQEANTRPLKSGTLGNKEILTMTVLDLALTMGQTRQTSMNLCDVAAKHLKSCKKLENTKHQEFFFRIHQLLCDTNVKSSLMDVFCDARIPLNAKDCKEKNDFWSELAKKLRSFKLSQNVPENLDDEVKSNGALGQKSFKEIIELCGNGNNYLEKVYSHLQILRTIINDETSVITESNILKNPLDSYFGHQIFDLNVEPSELESIANRLQVNLVYSILVNCCPKLTCDNEANSQEICNSQWGYIVLNRNLNETNNPEDLATDPNLYVSEILTDLLRTLRKLSPGTSNLNSKDLETFSKHAEVRAILKRTSILSSLDLSELLDGHHTLAFFLNLWNLLFLHSILYFWAEDPSFNDLRHAVSLMIIGYEIGDLGLVTLSTLRSKLLGTLAWDFKLFGQMESLNELAWQDLDLMQDSRSIFAMANEFAETPVIKVYSPQSLNEDLNTTVLNYLNNYKPNVGDSKEKINLPEIIQRYTNYLKMNSPLEENEFETLASSIEYFKSVEKDNYKPLSYKYDVKLNYTPEEKEEDDKRENSLESPNWKSRIVKPSLLRYLEGHCWLLSYLVQRIHEESPTILETCENRRTACLENVLNSPWTKILSSLFNENRVLASVQENLPLKALWDFFEESLKQENYQESLEVINAMPDNFLAKNVELQCFKDKILSLLSSTKDLRILNYIYQIKDINMLVQTILLNMHKWPMEVCEEALLHALHHNESEKLPQHCKIRMNETLCRVMIFRKILPYCESEVSLEDATWLDVVNCTEKTDPGRVIQSLIKENKFELCLEWLEYQSFSSEMHTLVIQDLFLGLLKNDDQDFKNSSKLLQALPLSQSITMCKGVLKRLENIKTTGFVVEFLLKHCKTTEPLKYRKALIGIEILYELDVKEQGSYIHLIKEPLLMLEQLLMNCKFETLQRTLNLIGKKLEKANISIESFDKVIRFYAGKSLDFRVAFQRDGVDAKSRDSQFLESDGQGGSEFVMPVNIPTKEEWIPNDKAKECSSCKEVIFSMFNRRHHCRRCGRVVCAMCSQHRMRISGYPNSVLVRVCKDCKLQTTLQQQAAIETPSAPGSEALESWKLTTDESYNQTVRDEFSFEYAPNISFCLAILNLHSDHKAYATFLLDQCDEMKKLLQPVSGGKVNPEIDHALIIKMIRSLLVAAKVKCAKLGLNAGLAHCDRFLSQVDLITTLVQSDCLSLIPTDDLDEHTLRKLRDLLTEKEQWTLALDVSTKSGLDTQGVWAAWGKACLKVGYFERAREKFSHCLDKALFENFDDWVILSHPESTDSTEDSESQNCKVELTSSRKHETMKSRPLKDPPLLTEILQILENLHLNGQGFKSSANTAQEILNTLNSLQAISQGNYPTHSAWNENVYYQESLYYLLMYGSGSSILEFFVKQGEFVKCLAFVLENDVEQDLFFNSVYLRCLRSENVENLLNALKSKDASLLIWKKYLVYICRNLEKKKLFNTLYHLQLFMKDYIRAAMTCIRFYKNEASTYSDLCERTHWLLEAQGHLEAELKVENFGSKKRRKSVSSSQSGSSGLTMEMDASEIDKHINTISRQMEISKFLGSAEKEGRAIRPFLGYLSDMDAEGSQSRELPTLFGNKQQKTQLAVLAILCGRDVEEGFGIAFRIMQDYNLRPQKVYSLVGHVLALEKKIHSIEQLIKCCRSSGAPDSTAISDRILAHCVKLLLGHSLTEAGSNPRDQVNSLIRLITDVELKISSYIESKQLKAAYLLAVKHSRAQDIRRILKEADRLGQNAIKSICTKWLQQTQGS